MDEKYLYKVVIAAVILNDKNEVLLAKRSMKEDVLPGYWGIPGGKVDIRGNIQDVLEAELKREVLEEVGVKITDLNYLESHLHESGKINLCFTARISEGVPQPLDETEKVDWFSLFEAKKMQLTPHTLDRIERALSKND